MKKFKKLFLSMALVVMLIVPVLLTGCGASNADAAKIYMQSAYNYEQKHQNYENYANTTYTINLEDKDVYQEEMEYKKNANDEEYVTKAFEFVDNYKLETTISYKKIDDNDMAFYLYSKSTDKHSGWDWNDDDTVERYSEQSINTIEYIVTKKAAVEAGEVDKYYWTRVEIDDLGTEDEEITKSYYEFEDRDEYVEFVEDLIEKSRVLVLYDTYYAFEGEMMKLMNLTENNGVVTIAGGYAFPKVDYDKEYKELECKYGSYNIEASVSKNGPETYKIYGVEGSIDYEYNFESTLKVKNSANGTFALPKLDEDWEVINGPEVYDYFFELELAA